MAKFRIVPHKRLQEWIAEERGYFAAEGLDYEFQWDKGYDVWRRGEVTAAEGAPAPVLAGAFESMADGRACEVSSACHWAVTMASSAQQGRMWGHAYSVVPSGIMVAADSRLRGPADLAGVEIGVGYHSGSHFSCLQALDPVLGARNVKLAFSGGPDDRLDLLLEGRLEAANVFGMQKDVVEQHGFRKVLDTTFMIGFLLSAETELEDAERYFRALRRAQRDLDAEPERYKHYYLRELDEKYHAFVDVRLFGAGERLVFEPYTRELFEQTHRWLRELELFPPEQVGTADYAEAVVG
jgi:NitT/TauT family transport system substrate-binding protein